MKTNIPRFVIEYANYQKRSICKNYPLMTAENKKYLCDRIDRAVYLLKKHFIILDEAMRIISLQDEFSKMPTTNFLALNKRQKLKTNLD